ncbi:MAG: hypothetical protein V3V20_05795 [Algisphaera sp.]
MSHDIREIRPDELAQALTLLGVELVREGIERGLSVGAFNPAGELLGVAIHQRVDDARSEIHVRANPTDTSDDTPTLAHDLVNRAMGKALAIGLRATQVTLYPDQTAADVWTAASWPSRSVQPPTATITPASVPKPTPEPQAIQEAA